jgi:hypothetical protein
MGDHVAWSSSYSLDYSIMRLVSALDPILVVATLRGQKLHDLEHAAAPAASVRSGCAVHRSPDLELVVAHIVTKGFSPGTVSRKCPLARANYLRTRLDLIIWPVPQIGMTYPYAAKSHRSGTCNLERAYL